MPEAYLKMIKKMHALIPISSINMNLSVMGITETQLSAHHSPSTIDIRSDRTTGLRGGVSLHVSNSSNHGVDLSRFLPEPIS